MGSRMSVSFGHVTTRSGTPYLLRPADRELPPGVGEYGNVSYRRRSNPAITQTPSEHRAAIDSTRGMFGTGLFAQHPAIPPRNQQEAHQQAAALATEVHGYVRGEPWYKNGWYVNICTGAACLVVLLGASMLATGGGRSTRGRRRNRRKTPRRSRSG
jgi:hypothetical protein